MDNIIPVSGLNAYVASLLSSDIYLQDIAIEGEISNLKIHYKTGHYYFTIKDNKASIKAVMWRSSAQSLAFVPQDGMSIIARGKVALYERDGGFQIYVQRLFPQGVGATQMAFEQLKKRLETEGLFDSEIKKTLPEFPKCVGLITSKTGAALQDILKVTQQRYPIAKFLLAPVSVQGQNAVQEIVDAIDLLQAVKELDVIIIARGGGSKEDLWIFNDERIARHIYTLDIPVVSAIGHEIDYTILDFVADVRAATPSAAAEIVFPDIQAVWYTLANKYTNIADIMQHKLHLCYNRLEQKIENISFSPLKNTLEYASMHLNQLQSQLKTAMRTKLKLYKNQFEQNVQLANSLNPYNVLARGYTFVKKDAVYIQKITQVKQQDCLDIHFCDGVIQVTVNEKRNTNAKKENI